MRDIEVLEFPLKDIKNLGTHQYNNLFNSKGKIFLHCGIINAGQFIPPHIHPEGTETYLYILKGNLQHKYGKQLEKSIFNKTGDLLHVPAGVPHQPINLSNEPIQALIISSYDQNDHQNVIPYDPKTDTILYEFQGQPPEKWLHLIEK